MPAYCDSLSPTSLFLNEFQLETMISGDNISFTSIYLLLLRQRSMVVVEVVASGSSGMFSFKKVLNFSICQKALFMPPRYKAPQSNATFLVLKAQILNHIYF